MLRFDISSMSAFLSQEPYLEFFDYPNSTEQGFITSSMAVGNFLGAVISSYIAERSGRRVTIYFISFMVPWGNCTMLSS